MSSAPDISVSVYTGDRKCAGTDNNVYIKLFDKEGNSSQNISLGHYFRNDFERGRADTFNISDENVSGLQRYVKIERIEIWKDKMLGVFDDDWFLDKIVVDNNTTNTCFVFPFFRWVVSGTHYNIIENDVSLPQNDPFIDERNQELERKRQAYEYAQHIPDGPVQIKDVPKDEEFTFCAKWDLATMTRSLEGASDDSYKQIGEFKQMSDVEKMYDNDTFKRPKSIDHWDSDAHFGRQRTQSINSGLIRLFSKLTEKFPITDKLIDPHLEGLSIADAIVKKRLFYCDLAILEDIPVLEGLVICKPIALLFLDQTDTLRPVAIQLFQKPGPENPIFTPSDGKLLWTCVKMWYNNADCCYHQAVTHLGFTHLLMEGVATSVNRNLSPTHPLFKVLAPHFLYIIAINSLALTSLVSPGGWVDMTMAYGADGMLALTVKEFKFWRMDVEGLVPANLKDRGLDDSEVLPGYYYREDALLLHNAIRKYVAAYVDVYYASDEVVKEDVELQSWADELTKERKETEGGLGLKGVPGKGKLESKSDIVDIITCIIYVCSVSHASANFGQYDEYGYPPNYPAQLKGTPPTSKQTIISEDDIVKSLPSSQVAHDIMVVTYLLSRKTTNSLGDFEVNYIFDPKALEVVKKFREDLEGISKKIKARNATIKFPYDDLLPEDIPNSISI